MARTPPRPPAQPRLVRGEHTLQFLDTLPLRRIAVPAYLVAAFWPWWTTLLVVSFVLWQLLPGIRALAWSTLTLAVLAGGGWIVQWALDRRADRDHPP